MSPVSLGFRSIRRSRHRSGPLRAALLFAVVLAQLAFVVTDGRADGGDFQLDFASATPGTYNQTTGTGGTFDDVVQQLEGGDFACGDVVQHLTEVVVDDGATGTQAIEITYSFDTETTSGDAVGYGDVTYASINPNDPNNQLSGNETVTLTSEQTVGEEIIATVEVTGLEAGEVLIVSVGAQLACDAPPGTNITGNIHATLESAETSLGDPINTGNDDTPLVGAGQIAQPGLNVTKSCPPDATVGENISYSITIFNTGNETLDITSVVDTVLGDLTESFPDTLGAGLSVTEEFPHEVGTTPDPLINVVTVQATGDISGQALTDTATCTTDVVHDADILVEKSCDPDAGIGDIVTYSITVTNTGDDVLENIVVTDTILGDLTGFSDTLDPGDSETLEFTHEVTAGDPDPLENEVTAEAVGVDSDEAVSSTANCLTDVTHVPGIAVEKTCPEVAAVGDEITYSITVTNTGDEPLTNVTVVDSVVGDLSGSFPDVLGVGESASLDYTHIVSDSDPDPLENTVAVSGTGEDSTATAEATAGCETAIPPPPPPELPVTGADLGRGLPLLLIFLLSGLAFLFLSRRPEMALAVVGSARHPVDRPREAIAGTRSGSRSGVWAARFTPYRGTHRMPSRHRWTRPASIRMVPRGP